MNSFQSLFQYGSSEKRDFNHELNTENFVFKLLGVTNKRLINLVFGKGKQGKWMWWQQLSKAANSHELEPWEVLKENVTCCGTLKPESPERADDAQKRWS